MTQAASTAPPTRKERGRLPAPLLPPDLVIQDELHLISGPLGTMAGLYEAAIEALCVRGDRRECRPPQDRCLYGDRKAGPGPDTGALRPLTDPGIPPPPRPDRRDSFFARTEAASKVPWPDLRWNCSPGPEPQGGHAQGVAGADGDGPEGLREAGGRPNKENPADPYMTVLGYFNSLKELGGARRILEEEIRNTIKGYGIRKRIGETTGLFRDRRSFSEVVELTSRVSTDKVAEARRRLGCGHHEKDRVDCAIATNMISVGLDIQRLGLMVVLGQPLRHDEYIQATSRIGRDDERPGLVVSLLNIHKPRDRSHYERFRHYHETFYRSVEVGSVTPFSARALDRGFAGALVTLARHGRSELTPAPGVKRIGDVRAELERLLLDAFLERVRQQPITDDEEREQYLRSVQNRVVDLLDSWSTVIDDYQSAGVEVQYQRYEIPGNRRPRPLLREILDRDFETEHHAKFRANRSMRDVEPNVNLFLKDLGGSRGTTDG